MLILVPNTIKNCECSLDKCPHHQNLNLQRLDKIQEIEFIVLMLYTKPGYLYVI